LGDYARTLVIENGVVCNEIDGIKKEEWQLNKMHAKSG
jgi:hypothetical protein